MTVLMRLLYVPDTLPQAFNCISGQRWREVLWRVITPLLLALAGLSSLGFPAYAQLSATGLNPYGAFDHGGLDHINLANLDTNVSLRLYERAGRQENFYYQLVYDSPIWANVYCGGTQVVCNVPASIGWREHRLQALGGAQALSYYVDCPAVGTGAYLVYYSFSFEDETGAMHVFDTYLDTEIRDCPLSNGDASGTHTYLTSDRSGWTLFVTTDRGGTPSYDAIIDADGNSSSDRNGNTMSGSGTSTPDGIPTSGTSIDFQGTAALTETFQWNMDPYKDQKGWYSFMGGTFTYPTATGNSGFTTQGSIHSIFPPCQTSGPFDYWLLDTVTFANGTSYSITYDSYGRLATVRLPTKGTYSYTYPGADDGFIGCNGIPMTAHVVRTVDGVSSWHFDINELGNTVVTEPNGSSFSHVVGYDGTDNGGSGNGKLIETCVTNTSLFLCGNQYVLSYTTRTTNIEDNSSSTVVKFINPYGKDYEDRYYDYGNNDPNSPDRRIVRTIDTSSVPVLTTEEQVFDHGILVSDTRYQYDQVPLASSGSPQLTTPFAGRRGNLTEIDRWRSGSTWIDEHMSYFDNGLLHEKKDGNGNFTTYSYGTCGNSFVTQVDHPLAQTEYTSWECNSAQVASKTDVNGNQTVFTYGDPYFSRLTKSLHSDGTSTVFAYDDTARTTETRVRRLTTASLTPDSSWTDEFTMKDDLGRQNRVMRSVGQNQWSTVDTTFDVSGNISFQTNPYFNSGPSSTILSSGSGISYGYDSYNRLKTTSYIQQGGATDVASRSYWGRDYSETDESGRSKLFRLNSFGEITQLCEITADIGSSPCGLGLSGSGFTTSYSYNALSNLLSVNQSGRTRQFSYNGQAHLITANNPETGTICYGQWSGSNCVNGYDSNGNLRYKTDSRGVTTNFAYDALDRVKGKTYSGQNAAATASSCYQYDTGASGNGNFIGRLTHEWTKFGSCDAALPSTGYLTRRSILAYDSMGRVLREQQCHLSKCTTGVPYNTTTGYNLAGNQTSHTNGIHSIGVMNNYDAAGHLKGIESSFFDAQHPASLFSVGSYTPAGAIQNMTLGTQINVTKSYDNRLRITGESATHP